MSTLIYRVFGNYSTHGIIRRAESFSSTSHPIFHMYNLDRKYFYCTCVLYSAARIQEYIKAHQVYPKEIVHKRFPNNISNTI